MRMLALVLTSQIFWVKTEVADQRLQLSRELRLKIESLLSRMKLMNDLHWELMRVEVEREENRVEVVR
jgi:hypothetical protein